MKLSSSVSAVAVIVMCGFNVGYAANPVPIHVDIGPTNQFDVWLEQTDPGKTYQFQSSTNLMAPWNNLGTSFIGDGRFKTERDFNDRSTGFYRAIETNNPVVDLRLETDLMDRSPFGRDATLVGGSETFAVGRTDHHTAYAFDGINMLDVPGIGSADALTLSMYVYLDDLDGPTPMLFDSGSLPGNVQLYLRDNHSGTHTGDGKDRDVGLVFKVHGNTGGNGVTGESVETTYRRFAEHSLDFLTDVGHERLSHHEHIWLHLAVTYSPSENRVDFYINGLHDGTKYFSSSQSPALGASRIGSDLAGANPLVGRISDFGIYEEALSAEQIRSKADFRQDLWAVRDIEQWTTDRTYYVDVANGNDGNDGSSGAPLSSIGEAIGRVNALSTATAPGSRIVIKPGVYREGGIVLRKNGSRFKPIIIEAETPGTVTLSGSEVWDDDSWSETAPGSGIWTHAWTYNFGRQTGAPEPVDESTEARYRRELVSMDRELMRPYMTLASLQAAPDPSSDVYMTDEHAFYVDEDNDLIYLRTTGNPNTSLMEVGIHEELLRLNLYYNNCEYVVIRGIRIQHSATYYGYHTGALNIVGSKHLLIEDCEIVDNGSSGMKSSNAGRDSLIRRCAFNRNGREGPSLVRGYSRAWVQDCVVEQNQWRNDLGNYPGPDLSGVGKIMFSSRLCFERVHVTDHNYAGIWADAQNWDITVDNCYLAGNTVAFFTEINTLNSEIINSACYYNRVDGAVIMDSESVRVENNVFKQSNVASWRGMLCSSHEVRTEQANIPDIYAAKNAVVRNNIIATAGTYGNLHHFDSYNVVSSTMISSGNTYYAPYTANLFNIENTAVSFADWHDNYLYDSTSQLLPPGSPPFVNDGTVTVGFESDWAYAPESRTALQVPVVLSVAVDDTITVDLSVEEITATEGDDFRVIGNGQITFSPLERSRVISVPIHRDLITEGEETFRLRLSSPGNAALGAIATFTVRIPANAD